MIEGPLLLTEKGLHRHAAGLFVIYAFSAAEASGFLADAAAEFSSGQGGTGCQLLRGEIQQGEKPFLQHFAFFEIIPDALLPADIAAAVAFQNVVQPFGQTDDLVMTDALVRIMDDFDWKKNACRIPLRGKIRQDDMPGDNCSDFREAKAAAEFRACLGMILAAAQARCFGDVVQERTADAELKIRCLAACFLQPFSEQPGNPCHHERMRPDIGQHSVLFHQRGAGGRIGNIHGLTAAEAVRRLNGNFHLIRRSLRQNAVAKVEDMALGGLAFVQNSGNPFL